MCLNMLKDTIIPQVREQYQDADLISARLGTTSFCTRYAYTTWLRISQQVGWEPSNGRLAHQI